MYFFVSMSYFFLTFGNREYIMVLHVLEDTDAV